jgi:hypothetical protein
MGRSGEDSYISSVTLENLKDRAITVFGIYIRLGRNHYIEIEEFEEAPLIIRAFETWYKEYEPIDFYAFNAQKLDMNDLLWGRKVRQQLVLSTGDGKHIVKEFHRPWQPVLDYFYKNPLIRPVGAVRLYHRGKVLGGSVRYVVEIIGEDGELTILPIYPGDHGLNRFGMILTKKSIEDHSALETFLIEQRKKGQFQCASFKILTVEDIRPKSGIHDGKERAKARSHGFFVFHIIGPLIVWYDRRKRKRESENAKKN